MSKNTLSKDDLLRNRAERAAKAKAAEEARELQELQLEDEFSEKLGKRGVDFEIVNSTLGCFVVQKPPFSVAKRFNAVPSDKRSEEEVIQFVAPCVVFPEQGVFRGFVADHGGLAYRCAAALISMYEAREVEQGKKY